jgi:hypothetical protein
VTLHVGSQRGASTDAAAQYLVRHGVTRWVPSPANQRGPRLLASRRPLCRAGLRCR